MGRGLKESWNEDQESEMERIEGKELWWWSFWRFVRLVKMESGRDERELLDMDICEMKKRLKTRRVRETRL